MSKIYRRALRYSHNRRRIGVRSRMYLHHLRPDMLDQGTQPHCARIMIEKLRSLLAQTRYPEVVVAMFAFPSGRPHNLHSHGDGVTDKQFHPDLLALALADRWAAAVRCAVGGAEAVTLFCRLPK